MSPSGISVLLLEDEGQLRTLWAHELARAGFVVDVAASCAEAIALTQRKPFDVFVFDHRLGDGTGVDVLRHARKHGHETPAIIVSGVATRQDSMDGGGLGALLFIDKPVAAKTLAEGIRNVVAAAAAETGSSSLTRAAEAILALDLDSMDIVACCRRITWRLMSHTSVDLPAFATLVWLSRSIAPRPAQTDLASIAATFNGLHRATAVADPDARLVLDCIAESTESDTHRLAAACVMSHARFLLLIRIATGYDGRFCVRMARVRRGFRLVAAGEKLDYAAEVAGFANPDQMSRDFHEVLGVTVTELRASVLSGGSDRRIGGRDR